MRWGAATATVFAALGVVAGQRQPAVFFELSSEDVFALVLLQAHADIKVHSPPEADLANRRHGHNQTTRIDRYLQGSLVRSHWTKSQWAKRQWARAAIKDMVTSGAVQFSLRMDDQQVPDNMVIEMDPGAIGINIDWDTGTVQGVFKQSQAEHNGLIVGMRIVEVDSEPFSEEVLRNHVTGSVAYRLTCQSPEAQQDSDALWMSYSELKDKFSVELIKDLIVAGKVATRINPDRPGQIEYNVIFPDAETAGAQELYRPESKSHGDTADMYESIMKVLKTAERKSQKDTDLPTSEGPLPVTEADWAKNAQETLGAEPALEALDKEIPKNIAQKASNVARRTIQRTDDLVDWLVDSVFDSMVPDE